MSTTVGLAVDQTPEESHSTQESLALSDKENSIDSPLPEALLPPDGTLWGWLAVLGGFCLSVSTFGFIVSWGTFQAYYESALLTTSSPSAIAWIGSIQYALIFIPGIVAGHMFGAGYFRPLMLGGSGLYIVANFLIAECKHYWQFLLCQGIALGLASGLMYVPCVILVSQWFRRKRALAFSLVSLGVSIGGIIFPIIFKNLLPSVGFKWTVRVTAFLNLAMFIIACLTMYPRGAAPSSGPWISYSDFLEARYTFYVLCTFTAFLGLYTMLTFISVSALSIGIGSSLAFYLVTILNAASAVGRLLGGVYALKYGPMNALIVFTSVAAVCTYVWPFVMSHAGFIALTCVYGVSSGAFVGLFPVGSAALCNPDNVARRTGMQMSVMALGALAGPPISGAIFDSKKSFKPVGIYAGSTIVLSVALMFVTRFAITRKLWGGRV